MDPGKAREALTHIYVAAMRGGTRDVSKKDLQKVLYEMSVNPLTHGSRLMRVRNAIKECHSTNPNHGRVLKAMQMAAM